MPGPPPQQDEGDHRDGVADGLSQVGCDGLRIRERDPQITSAQLAEVRVRLAQTAEAVGRYDEAEELCDLAIEWFVGQGDRKRAVLVDRQEPAADTVERKHCAVISSARSPA